MIRLLSLVLLAVIASTGGGPRAQAIEPTVARSGPGQAVVSLPDPRLDEPLSFTFRSGPCSALAPSLAQEAGVPLALSTSLQNVRLSVLGKSSTLRAVLGGLQWSTAATWTTRGSASDYRLELTERDRTAAANARRRSESRGLARLRARWDQVRQWANLDERGLDQLAKVEPGMASCLRHPKSAAALRLAVGLPAGVWQKLWASGVVRFTVRALPESLHGEVQTWAAPYQAAGVREQSLSGAMKLQIAGPPSRPTVWQSIEFGNGGSDTNLCYAEGWVRQSPASRRAAALANPSAVPNDPLFKARVSLRDPQGAASAQSGERPPDALPLLPLVEQLAKQLDVPVVVQCDYRPRPEEVKGGKSNPRLDRGWLRDQWWLGEAIREVPLARALDLLCADFEYEWSFRRGVVCLRHSRWYLPEEWRMHGRPLESVILSPPMPGGLRRGPR